MKLYTKFRKPPFFLSVSHWIDEDDHPIQSGSGARRAVMIPPLVMQYGSLAAKFRSFMPLREYFYTCLRGMRESAQNITRNPEPGKRTIAGETLAELEAYAKSLGISTIGYTRVNPDFIFEGFEILYDRAMILTMEMDREPIATSPSQACNQEIFRTYAGLGVAVNKIADWLRDRGYACHPSPAIGGDINTVPTAQDANLGCIGKNGILVTPEYGPCARLAAVFIDVDDLPIPETNDHRWIADFCETCNRCVETCPGGAIHEEPRYLEDGTRVYIEREKCAPAFSEGCSVCISSCVFTGGHYDRLKAAYDRKHAAQGEE